MSTTKRVVIVRTGTANIGSVVVGLKRSGADPVFAYNPQEILDAEYVMVPGVGSFGSALENIKGNDWEKYIKKRIVDGLPTMLICVGLQILSSESEESEGVKGLGIFDNKITRFSRELIVPQQAWNYVTSQKGSRIIGRGYAYYSNSYKMDRCDNNNYISSYSYYGSRYIAAVENGNVIATQFHPELSGNYGLSIFRRWLGLESLLEEIETEELIIHDKIPRIIPCMDIKAGQVVKGIKFQNMVSAGDPAERAAAYQAQGADEIVVLDISATDEERSTTLDTISLIRKYLSVPLCVGGGVSNITHAENILNAGADKVAVNTAAVRKPELISQMAEKFGRQCTVLSLDAATRKDYDPNVHTSKWEVVIAAGKERTGLDAVEYAVDREKRGAGEILLTSWDRDGTKSGYDVELLKAISSAVTVPVIASGGGSCTADMAAAIAHGADAVLAASIFHYNETTVGQVKRELQEMGIPVRTT